MGSLSKPELLNKIIEAIQDSGWNVLYISRSHPFKLNIYNDMERRLLNIHIWNLSHGGGYMRPHNEYRIQPKVEMFIQETSYVNLLLGWWEEGNVFAGFDIRKHEMPAWSASIQIKEEALRLAYMNSFATSDKGNQEIAIAFRKDFFVEYVCNLQSLHDFGEFSEDLQVLDNAVQHPEINDNEINIDNTLRREIVVSVKKRVRDVSFQRRVLTAYAFRCAMCGVQLKLVQAAHIVPVSHDQSNDKTSNGLALCALHHLAFDRSLISVDENYAVVLNENQVVDLQRNYLADGLDKFRKNIRDYILLPPEIAQRPYVEYIRIANKIRGWNL